MGVTTKPRQQAAILNVWKYTLYIRGAIKVEKFSQSTTVMQNGLKDYHKTMFDVDQKR